MSRVEGILNWYTENNQNDPNMYELIEVLSEYSRNADDSEKKVEDLVKLELTRLISNGIVKDTNDSLISMVMDFGAKALNGYPVPQELEDYAKKVAGVSFWIKQEERNGKTVSYGNYTEYEEILKYEDTVIDRKINISDYVRDTMDFIGVHCDDSLKQLREQHINARTVNKTASSMDNNRMVSLVMMTEPYVYPEKFNKMLENANTLLDATIETIIGLGKGLDFDTVKEKLDKKDISGFGYSFTVGQAALYAKNGPEFFMYLFEKDGEKLDDETLAWIGKLKEENKKLEEKYGEKTDSSNYSV